METGHITRVRSPYSYEVQMSDKSSCRCLHANKLRPFADRVQNVGVIKDQDVDFKEVVNALLPPHLLNSYQASVMTKIDSYI